MVFYSLNIRILKMARTLIFRINYWNIGLDTGCAHVVYPGNDTLVREEVQGHFENVLHPVFQHFLKWINVL